MSPENIQILLVAAIGIVFWLFILRPQTQKLKAEEEFKSKVTEGEKVVTSGGIHGKIIAADEYTVTINIAKGTNIRVERAAISMALTNSLNGRKSNS